MPIHFDNVSWKFPIQREKRSSIHLNFCLLEDIDIIQPKEDDFAGCSVRSSFPLRIEELVI